MSEEQPQENNNQEITPQIWFDHLREWLVLGSPLFVNGNLGFNFTTESEIFTVALTRKPNNVIQFPVAKKQ